MTTTTIISTAPTTQQIIAPASRIFQNALTTGALHNPGSPGVHSATLDTLQAIQHVPKFNQLVSALGAAALFSLAPEHTQGLNVALRGGVFRASTGVVIILGLQKVVLTPSATNYLSCGDDGLVVKATAAPAGWPAPTSGATALYQLVTNANAITSGTCYVLSRLSRGPNGPQGVQGPAGAEVYAQRPRITMYTGNGSTNSTTFAASTWPSSSSRTVASTPFPAMTPYGTLVSSTNVANTSGAFALSPALVWRGNAAGLGGFKFGIRFILDTTFTSTTQKSFIGIYDYSGTPGNVEPDTFLNCVGVGANGGEANFSRINNDGSGTATKVLLVSDDVSAVNFPARSTDKMYELIVECAANGSSFDCSFMDCETLKKATWSVTSDMPAATLFLTYMVWINNGSAGTNCIINAAQAVLNSRF
jgi:hypothetical protein